MHHKFVTILGVELTDQILNVIGGTVLLANVIIDALQPNWLTVSIGVSLVLFNLSRVYYYVKKAHKKEDNNVKE